MSSNTRILIDSSSRILYTSFYIEGLYDFFGKENVLFSSKQFMDLKRHSDDFAFEHYFAFIIKTNDGNETKIVIDFCDATDINKNAYEWCNVYAKINLDKNDRTHLEKTISIPPGFGIKVWNKWETLYYCFSNLIKCRLSPIITYKRFFQDYYSQYKRSFLSDYQNKETPKKEVTSGKPYIYLIATLWQDTDRTNKERKTFIESVKAQNCNFEGGFFVSKSHPKIDEYKNLIFTKPYSSEVYIEKSKQSDFVFNSPAVHNCHGWKLAEYLAMGKAIISTPISNELPVSLEHEINIHIIRNKSELDAAISRFINDKNYSHFLSQNAHSYYEEFVKPKSVIRSILNPAFF